MLCTAGPPSLALTCWSVSGSTAATAAEITAFTAAEELLYNSLDDRALGIIEATLPATMINHGLATSHLLWNHLAMTYGTMTPSATYTTFVKALSTMIPMDKDPAPCIAELEQLFQLLHDGTVEIPAALQAMIMLKALPPQFDNMAQTLLVSNTTLATFTVVSVRNAILAAYQQQTSNSITRVYSQPHGGRPQ